jgi:hypothetical protein
MMPAERPRPAPSPADVAQSTAYFLALMDTLNPRRKRFDITGEIGEAYTLLLKDCEAAGLMAHYERTPAGRYLIPETVPNALGDEYLDLQRECR